MNRLPGLLLAFALAIAGCTSHNTDRAGSVNLEDCFDNPPQSAKPMVWWHWMNGNISPDGLRKDILWMHRAGIGGFHMFDAALDTPQMVDERLAYMSPEWISAFRGAIALADSLGMEVAIASSPGYSSTGGPWVEPADAMKKLTWRTMEIEGGRHFNGPLPEPFTVSSRFHNVPLPFETNHHQDGPIPEWYYKDIAVYAVKLPSSYRSLEELGATVSSSGGSFDVRTLTDGDLNNAGLLPAGQDGYGWIQYEFPESQSFKAVTIVNRKARSGAHGKPATCKDSLQLSDDGINWRTLCGITQGAAQEQTEYIPSASARFWRLKHPNPAARYHFGILQSPADPASEIGEFNLLSYYPVNHFEEKAGFAATCDLALYPSSPDAEACQVLDISRYYANGVLDWNAPAGRWLIYRFGTSLTGKKNHPSSPEATGLEVDKLDKDAFSRYLHTYLDMYKDAAGGLLGARGIQYLLMDSYESKAQNWTPKLRDEFIARRGYDPMPWLPATAGVVIESAEATERFLWDFRRTLGELFAENYDKASEICRRDYGMNGVFIESHEHGRNCLADGISIKKTASYPMSAMWIQSTLGGSQTRRTEGIADIRESASTAHIYGQNLVAAESFTASGVDRQAYSYCPENLKPTADLEMASGINRFVIHESAHQPSNDKIPGMGMSIYGQWFNRNECWAEQASAWIDYLSRSCALLQQGRYVADFLYYYGEDSNVTAQFSRNELEVPFGYSFDYIGPEALMKELKVKKGRLVTRSGMQYSALCIGGNGSRMSDEVRKCIERLKRAGARVIENGSCIEAVKGLDPDIRISGDASPFMFIHRTAPEAEIYWIGNRSGKARSVEVSFRCTGRKPELWNAENATRKALPWKFADGRCIVPLEFTAGEAYFVVFREETEENSCTLPSDQLTSVRQIEGPWHLSFQEKRGAPASAVFYELKSLTEADDPGIRYFSGTTVYSCDFDFSPSDGRIELDLGRVYNIAQIKLNGKALGTLWRSPFRIDISEALVPGKNSLEIAVTNLWPNRLIGDEQPNVKQRITYTTWPFYKASDPLLPSGLTGPVRILCYNGSHDYTRFENPGFARMIDEDPAFAALNHCPYPKVAGPFEYTDAPKGYKPVYLSHYGRHGSRSGSSFKAYEKLFETLSKAKDEGKLTAEGDKLLQYTEYVIDCTGGMAGRLTFNGQIEHSAIADRMYHNFPELFEGKKRIEVLGSEIPRCLVSMAAFTNRLCKLNGELEINMDCGSEIQKIIMNNTSTTVKKDVSERVDSLDRSTPKDYSVLLARLFTGDTDISSIVDDVDGFAKDIYTTLEIVGAFDPDSRIMEILPLELRYTFARNSNVKIYLRQCNSRDYGNERMSLAAPLAKDIVVCADSALAGNGTAANLRFGHDWPLLAISSLIGVEGVGERYSLEESAKHFITTLNSPFAGNLQIIFYRSSDKDSPVLVKCLLNEKERRLIGLESDNEPFYKWADLKERLLSYIPK